jgi:hypothetical protein
MLLIRLPSPITAVACLSRVGILGVIAPPHAAFAQTAAEKGLAVAAEAERRDAGFRDSSVLLRMTLRTREGDESVRELYSQTLEGTEDGDRMLVVFDSPPDVRGTAFLAFAHEQGADDQWLYLPALKRVRRIAPANQSGPFMGSEFSYEDMTSQEIEKFTYLWLRDERCPREEYATLDCFVVERRPSYASSGYTRQIVWIDQREYRTVRIDYFDRRDAPLKSLVLSGFRQYGGRFWRPTEMVMTNLQTGKTTRLEWQEYRFGAGLGEADFNPQNLTRTR